MSGHRMSIWKQDPSVTAVGVRPTFVHTPVTAGPGDADITIVGVASVDPDDNDDYIAEPSDDPTDSDLDAIHTFAVIRQVVTMYKRALVRITGSADFAWQWGAGTPITVNPRAGEDRNAFYSRNDKTLQFFFFDTDDGTTVHTCRSFDIVAHETGHAVLDALKPGFLVSSDPQTGGLHESFGDLTAIFTMLSQLDICEAVIAESKGDLRAKGFISSLAEEFGSALFGHDLGLRNANNDKKLSEVSTEVHDISVVFTGAVYDAMAALFEAHRDYDTYDPAETLFRVGQHMASLVMIGLLTAPDTNATYADVANKMEEFEPVEEWKPIIHEAFAEREVFDAEPMAMGTPDFPAPRCSTMAHAMSATA